MPKSLSELLGGQDSSLGGLVRHANQMERLGDRLRAGLPESLAGGFVHCNLREDGTLAVLASSSV